MSASLDQSNSPALSADRSSEDFSDYRSLSALAVVSLLFGVLSIVALLPDYWSVKAVPVVGILFAGASLLRIRSRSDELSGMRLAAFGLGLSAFCLIGGSAYSIYTERTMVPPGYRPITYAELKPTDDKPNSPPEAARTLDGQRVFIRGYMFPGDQGSSITRFILCRDSGDCCFGGDPPISDMILIQLQDPLQTKHTNGIRNLAGTFRVAGARDSKVRNQILYKLEADYIK